MPPRRILKQSGRLAVTLLCAISSGFCIGGIITRDRPLPIDIILLAVNTTLVFVNIKEITRHGRHWPRNPPPHGNSAAGTGSAGPGTCNAATFAHAAVATRYQPHGGPGEDPRVTSVRENLRAALGNSHVAEATLKAMLPTIALSRIGGAFAINVARSNQPNDNIVTFTVGQPPPKLPAPDMEVGEIIGHRLWRVVMWYDHPTLTSTYMPVIWPHDRAVQAKIIDEYICAEGRGVHASKDVEQVLCDWMPPARLNPQLADQALFYVGDTPVPLETMAESQVKMATVHYTEYLALGTVKLWGTVIEHERGYRAEFGRVHSIDMIIGPNTAEKNCHLLNWLREVYNV